METKRLLSTMLLAVSLILLLNWGLDFYARKQGWDLTPKPNASATQPIIEPASNPSASQVSTPATSTALADAGKLKPAASAAVSGPVTLGSTQRNDPKYPIGLVLNPTGAGVDRVVLNPYKRVVDKDDAYVFEEPYVAGDSSARSLTTRAITINGTEAPHLDAAAWTLESSSETTATYSLTIVGEAGPVARLRKIYQVLPASDVTKGYEVIFTQSIENLTPSPMTAKLSFNGTNLPPRESDRGGERYILGGYLYKGVIDVHHDAIESFSRDKPSKDLTKDKNGNAVMWFGAASTYFQALVRPLPLGDPNTAPDYLASVTAQVLNPDAKAEDHAILSTIATSDLSITPGGSVSIPMRVFFGPRQRKLLNDDYYASFPLSYDSTLVLTSGPCGICTFNWLINLLVVLLRIFHFILRDWGLAIIGLVVLVRAVLHPITKKSQISMAKMGKLGPEMERLKKKYADNKEELTKAMWQLQKEQGMAGAYLGCLPMFLQMPIWIALWQSLQTTFEMRQAPFLWGFTWINDLSKPDHLIQFSHTFDFFFLHFSGLNVLPILMGVIFWLQMKFQPKPATMTKEQEQQQKMMQMMMPFIFPLMLYSGPSGLNLYILTSTAIGIVESKIVRDHIRQREEAEKAGRIIVDAKPTRASKQGRPVEAAAAEKPGCLGGWFANLQNYAEQVQRESQNKRR